MTALFICDWNFKIEFQHSKIRDQDQMTTVKYALKKRGEKSRKRIFLKTILKIDFKRSPNCLLRSFSLGHFSNNFSNLPNWAHFFNYEKVGKMTKAKKLFATFYLIFYNYKTREKAYLAASYQNSAHRFHQCQQQNQQIKSAF